MAELAPLAEIVDTHIAKATANLARLARSVPIVERDEHRTASGEPLMVDGLDDVTVARHEAHLEALEGLDAIEQRNHELGEARDRITQEMASVQAAVDAWHVENAHHAEHHGSHTYLGLDDPDALQQALHERDEEIRKLRAQLDGKDA